MSGTKETLIPLNPKKSGQENLLPLSRPINETPSSSLDHLADQEQLIQVRDQLEQTTDTNPNLALPPPEPNHLSFKEKVRKRLKESSLHKVLELVEISKNPKRSKKHFETVLKAELEAGRLAQGQWQKFQTEIPMFAFDKTIKDILFCSAINAGTNLGMWIGGGIFLGKTFTNKAKGLGALALSSFIPKPSLGGFFKAPYVFFRSVQELGKIGQHEGWQTALKQVPFFTSLNFLNLIDPLDWAVPVLISLPRNKDIGLAYLNNQVQNSGSPQKIKDFVNNIVQKLYQKPKPFISTPQLKPLTA